MGHRLCMRRMTQARPCPASYGSNVLTFNREIRRVDAWLHGICMVITTMMTMKP